MLPRLLFRLSLGVIFTVSSGFPAHAQGAPTNLSALGRGRHSRITLARYAGMPARFAAPPMLPASVPYLPPAPRLSSLSVAPRPLSGRFALPPTAVLPAVLPAILPAVLPAVLPSSSRLLSPRVSASPHLQNVAWRAPATSSSNRSRRVSVTNFAAAPIALGAYFYQNGQCAPGDDGAVSAWRASTGRLPAVWMIYQGWTGWNRFPIQQAQRARELGARLQVTWEPWSGARDDLNWSCARIAAGQQDAYIRQYARDAKAAGVPVMLRFAHEMNGDWYPWGTAFRSNSSRHNGNSPRSFVAMWRHVVSIFRQEGASNVSWVWAPNIFYLNAFNSVPGQQRDLAALYPGDDCVDWIGLSVYNDGARRPWNSFSTLCAGAYRAVTQISGKPLMIAELGATEAGAPYGTSKAAWIEQAMLRDIPGQFPRVKLVTWFCRDKTSVGEANYRFDSSPSSLRAFQIAANSPLYAGSLAGR